MHQDCDITHHSLRITHHSPFCARPEARGEGDLEARRKPQGLKQRIVFFCAAPRLVPRAFCLLRAQHGVSIVELMIGVTVASAIVSAGYGVMTSTDRAAQVNDQTAEMQQNARVAMELLTRDLKLAGFGMNGPVGACANALVPSDNNTAGADTGPDSFSVVAPTSLSTLATPAVGGALSITLQPGAVAAMSSSGFGNGAILSIGGVSTTSVANIVGDTLTLASSLGQSVAFPAGTQVFWITCVTYAVSTNAATCAGTAPCLLRGGVPLAEGIEDLQVAYACDGCGGVADGVIDDQNASGTFDTSDFVSNSTWSTGNMTPVNIRLARVSIVARQIRSDSNWGSQAPVVAEDHNPATDPGFTPSTYQQIRRRLYTKTVQVRNLGL